jgi:TolB protein
VVFASLRAGGGFGELYAMPLAGGAATRLTTTARAETAPALSADGQRLAYAYDVSGVYRIWTANANGTGAAAYTGSLGFSGSPETSPSWAPAGNRLAFVGTAQGQADIWDLASGGTARILAGGDPADVDPAWSPDGSVVAFASTREGDPAIFTVRLSDLQVTRLSTRTGSEAEPTWTADGRLVYVEFTSSTVTRLVWIDPADPGTVHVIPVTGGAPRRPSAVR